MELDFWNRKNQIMFAIDLYIVEFPIIT